VQLKPISSCSLVTLLSQLLKDLPLFLFPTDLCSSACLTMFSFFFLNVCPIQFYFLRFTVVSPGSCFVAFHSSMLLILSGQCIFSIFFSDLFMKVCNFCVVSLSTFQVSASYSNTLLIVQLHILTFVSVETAFVLHMPSNGLNTCCALLILVSISGLLPHLKLQINFTCSAIFRKFGVKCHITRLFRFQ
jgi:hypothetical protein